MEQHERIKREESTAEIIKESNRNIIIKDERKEQEK